MNDWLKFEARIFLANKGFVFFGGGGGGSYKAPPEPTLPPVRIQPEIEKAKFDLREKLRRRRGRSASMTGFGLYDIEAPATRPVLADVLGKGPR